MYPRSIRCYLNKKQLKKTRLVWMKEPMPRSLFKLSTRYCETVEKSKKVKDISKTVYKNIQVRLRSAALLVHCTQLFGACVVFGANLFVSPRTG